VDGRARPTDVLSFPMDELRPAPMTATWKPAGRRLSPPSPAHRPRRPLPGRGEPDLLCTHGIPHLLGYDHAEPTRSAMFSLQRKLLGDK
jgi:probable rRNA maturation factor